jgi:endoribonuclease Dicer
VKPLQTLPDVVESIVGAIYISDNFSPVGAEALFDNVLKPFYDRHITLKTLSHHPTKILFELFQAQGCHQFELIKERQENVIRCDGKSARPTRKNKLKSYDSVIVHDIVLASARDTTATAAGRRASLSALDALEGDAAFMACTCDCRTNKTAQKKAFNQIMAGFGDEENILAEDEAQNVIARRCDTAIIDS